MRLLALDAATAACSAAVWADGRIVARRHDALERGHAERLVPMVEAVMDEACLTYGALDGVAATVGPGSFTGVRVGLATARALALAAGLPLVGVTTLAALAAAVPGAERAGRRVLAALDARRSQVYAQVFEADGAPMGEPRAMAPADASSLMAGPTSDRRPVRLVGSGASLILPALRAEGWQADVSAAPELPDAAHVAALAAHIGLPDPAAPPPAPLYLRDAGVGRPRGQALEAAP